MNIQTFKSKTVHLVHLYARFLCITFRFVFIFVCFVRIYVFKILQFLALFMANDRLPRTCASLREFVQIRANSADVRQKFANFFSSRTLVNVRVTLRTFSEFCTNSPKFALIRAWFAKMSSSSANFKYSANVCRERVHQEFTKKRARGEIFE